MHTFNNTTTVTVTNDTKGEIFRESLGGVSIRRKNCMHADFQNGI